MTIPEKDLWVNLSPYEKDRIVPEALGQTALGRDLLAQDYFLKQLTASLIYPEKGLGKTFWDRVYAQAQQKFGTSQIPVNTFNKVWIMADKANVYESGQTAFVLDGHLKVMLEEDYLALQKNAKPKQNAGTSQIVREIPASISTAHAQESRDSLLAKSILQEIIIPELEREVNTGKNFATLRQIYNSLILASWYKKNLKEALLNEVYTDKSMVKGVDLSDPSIKEKIYEQYLKAYKQGVFNYIKEEPRGDGQTLPKKYFSGGFGVAQNFQATYHSNSPGSRPLLNRAMQSLSKTLAVVAVALVMNSPLAVSAAGYDAKTDTIIDFSGRAHKAPTLDEMIERGMDPRDPRSFLPPDYFRDLFGFEEMMLADPKIKTEVLRRIAEAVNPRGAMSAEELAYLTKFSSELLRRLAGYDQPPSPWYTAPGVTIPNDVQVDAQKAKRTAGFKTTQEWVDYLENELRLPRLMVEELRELNEKGKDVFAIIDALPLKGFSPRVADLARGFLKARFANDQKTQLQTIMDLIRIREEALILRSDDLLLLAVFKAGYFTILETKRLDQIAGIAAEDVSRYNSVFFGHLLAQMMGDSDQKAELKQRIRQMYVTAYARAWAAKRNTLNGLFADNGIYTRPMFNSAGMDNTELRRMNDIAQGIITAATALRLANGSQDRLESLIREWDKAKGNVSFAFSRIFHAVVMGRQAGDVQNIDFPGILDTLNALPPNRRPDRDDLRRWAELVQKNRTKQEKAMVAPDEADQAVITETSDAVSPGGIDLKTANLAMTVTKDGNGGVQVLFDPLLLEDLRTQGIKSANPIIVDIKLMSSAQIPALLSTP